MSTTATATSGLNMSGNTKKAAIGAVTGGAGAFLVAKYMVKASNKNTMMATVLVAIAGAVIGYKMK